MSKELRAEDVLESDEDLMLFHEGVAEFDQKFCDVMVNRVDFTLTLEVRGDGGQLIHCRTNANSFRRPGKVKEEIKRKRRLPGPK